MTILYVCSYTRDNIRTHVKLDQYLLFLSKFMSHNLYKNFMDTGVKLTTQIQLVPRSRMGGAIPPISNKSSWRGA